MAAKSEAKSIVINSKKNTKTSRESNKNNKISSQRSSRNKMNEVEVCLVCLGERSKIRETLKESLCK